MGRFRSFVRRMVRPAAMLAICGGLSFSLVITTPSTAQALTPKLPVTPTWVFGAVKTVAPVAMAAASLTPIGWGLRIVQLAFLAYETKDMWMPFVTGLWGQATGNAHTQADGSVTGIDSRVHASGMTPNQTFGVTITGTTDVPTTGSTQQNFYISVRVKCNAKADGTGAAQPDGVFAPNSSFTQTSGRDWSLSVSCQYGYPIGAIAGPRGSDPLLTAQGPGGAPSDMLRWGTLMDAGFGAFNPRGNDVGYKGSSECIDSMGNKAWVDGPTTPGDNGAVLMPSCEKAGKGHGTGRTKVVGFRPDGGSQTLWDTGAQPLSDPATPLCDPGRATSGCVMEVLKDDLPCKSGDPECENWSEESSKTPSRYKCKLGPYTLPMASCALLEKAYWPGGGLLNDENTDGNPATGSNAGPDGSLAPAPAPVVTGAAAVPGAAGQPSPSAETKDRECFPNGWGLLNPVDWLMKPMRCLFEPSRDTSSMQTIFRDKLKMKAPASWVIAAAGMEGPSGSAACPNWVVHVGGQFSQNVVCESSFTGAILGIRGPLFGIIATAMIWPLIRSIWYASIPVLRVTPTGGK